MSWMYPSCMLAEGMVGGQKMSTKKASECNELEWSLALKIALQCDI